MKISNKHFIFALTLFLLHQSSAYAGNVTTTAQLYNAINNGSPGDTINISAGVYVLNKQLKPKKDMIITGSGNERTILQAAGSWKPSTANLPKTENPTAYFILLDGATGVKINNLKITGKNLHGAIYADNADGLELSNMVIQDFLWSGVRTYRMDNFKVYDNAFINAGGKIKFSGGALHMNYTKDSEFWNNKITKTPNHPTFYGFKGRKGTNLRFYNNDVQVNFSFEFPFEKDSNIEIDHNRFTGVISIPRLDGGPQQPAGKFSYHIHHNWLQKSYALEWARNGAIINNNLFDFATSDDGGNLVSSFGNRDVDGDTRIHNNLISNPGRGLFWGRAAYNNFKFYNNHVRAKGTSRKDGLFGFSERTKFSTIAIQNNIFENIANNPRKLMRNTASYKAVIENNTLINVGDSKSFTNKNTGEPRGPFEPLNFTVGVNGQYLVNNWDVCDTRKPNCMDDTIPNPTPDTTPEVDPKDPTPDTNPKVNPEQPTAGEQTVSLVKLKAKDAARVGSDARWGKYVTVSALNVFGKKASVNIAKTKGLAVQGNRYKKQIDYDAKNKASETLILTFASTVSDISLDLAQLSSKEWSGLNETGKWIAYATNGNKIAEGIIDAGNGQSVNLERVSNVKTVHVKATAYGNGRGQRLKKTTLIFLLRDYPLK